MSSISAYESLKSDGTRIDCLKYILSLENKTEIENYLKQSLSTSYDDLEIFIDLSISMKNEQNLLEIFQKDTFPIQQRAHAAKFWMKFQKDEKQIANFVVQTINDPNCSRYLKHHILKYLHQNNHLKNSPSFFYELTCRLTENRHHEEYNIDGHLVPFCQQEQIFALLSQWSIQRLEQIDTLSIFYSKLIRYQPMIIISLMKEDLKEKQMNSEIFSRYFQGKEKLIELIIKKEGKEFLSLMIDYLNQLEKHQRFLPYMIERKQKYFFQIVPNQMIELITIAASNQPGSIKYQTSYNNEGADIDSFSFPSSFSLENYLHLFFALYETCHWSSNHTIDLLKYMFENKDEHANLSSIKKRRKWFFDIVIKERIGEEIFLKKLLKEGNETTLQLLDEYPELTTPLSLHLLSKFERHGIVKAEQRLSLIRYQLMTKEIFEEFLSLFKQTGSDVNQRVKNYPLFFQCALSTNEEYISNVLQWIEKRLINEQLIVIEHFLRTLSSLNNQFRLEILPKNFKSIESIIDIAINHLQQSTNTLEIIINYGIVLLKHSEQHTNKEQIQQFATKIIKRCYSKNVNIPFPISSINESYPSTRDIIIDILISDIFPKLVSKCLINELDDLLSSCKTTFWHVEKVDSFLESFFTNSLPSSSKLQSSFQIDRHSSMISLYLKNPLTRFARVKQLINQIDQIFFLDENVQRVVLRSEQHRQFIDQLIQDDKSLTYEKLANEQSKFAATLNSTSKKQKLPGLNIDLLSSSSQFLTEKQQEHITNIILNDYLQDAEVSNLDKLKSLRVLRRLTHTYNTVLQWLEKTQDSSLAVKNPNERHSGQKRGAALQPLDDIIICLPATFDLTPQQLLQHLEFLKTKLNAKNAKFISDAMLNISRKIPDEIFLKNYLDFIRNEQFQKLGITANKEILRLLNEYISDPSLVQMTIKPIWDSHPHQDIRACLVLILLHFLSKSNSNDDQTIIWEILEEAADDDYLPVVECLFADYRGKSRLKHSSNAIYETFVNRIQFKVLDHPKSLQARSQAWANIDHEHCDTKKLIEKVQQLCFQFDKDANQLWKSAFDKIIALYKRQKVSSIDIITDILQKIMSRRDEIDSKENALDNQHDLPVYHRIQRLLTNFNSEINQFDNEKKIPFRSLTPIILQFDKTLAPQMGTLLIKISQNKEDLENVLKVLQENLSENYFQRLVTEFSTFIIQRDSCPFIQQLNIDEKLQLAQWFIKEKNRPLFVFDLLKNTVFNQFGVDRQVCQDIIRQIRQNEDLYLQQQAMEYTVPWDEDGVVKSDNDDSDDDQMSVSEKSYSTDMS